MDIVLHLNLRRTRASLRGGESYLDCALGSCRQGAAAIVGLREIAWIGTANFDLRNIQRYRALVAQGNRHGAARSAHLLVSEVYSDRRERNQGSEA